MSRPSKVRSVRRLRPRRLPRRWRHRLEPPETRARRPTGRVALWLRARRLLWSWWVWALLAVVAVAVDRWGWAVTAGVITVVTHLAAPREHSPTDGLDHPLSAADPAFLDTVVGLTGTAFAAGNRVEILNNGDEFYPAMLDAIERAQHSITIEAYIYWAGDIGERFAKALARRAEQGVPVKILLDAVGSSTIGTRILETLEHGGCQLAWFNPVRWYTIGRVNYRTHRKSFIIDGRVAFTGGAGIADHWCGRAQDAEHWRDIQVRIEGPGAVPLQTGFALNWVQTTGELVSGPAFFPDIERGGPVDVQTVLSSPSTGTSAARTLYYFPIACAERRVWIANPYFVPDPVAIATLVAARARGVDVKVLVAGRHNDNWLARQNSRRLYGPLLEHGVEIYEYNRTMLHQKVMTVDGLWATLGSTNFDNRSFAFNEESNVALVHPRLIEELERVFEADLQVAEAIALDRWQARGAVTRAQEFVASFFQDQV